MAREHLRAEWGWPWGRVLGTVAGALVGAVLLVAAWGKAIDPEAFVEQIRLEGLAIFGLGDWVALSAIALEFFLGTALIIGVRRLWVLLPTLGLVVFFLFLTGRAYWRFEHGLIPASESCSCFGNLVSRTPAEAFWQDLFLLGVPAVVAFAGRSGLARPFPRRRLLVSVTVTVAGIGLALLAPELPLDDWATRLKPGVRVADLCAGAAGSAERICLDTLIGELDSGRHWVVLTGLDEPDFLAALPRLNERVVESDGDDLWVVTAASSESVTGFTWTHGPAFDIREAPLAMLRPLYRRLPRSFRIEEGVVVETWSGLPPEPI